MSFPPADQIQRRKRGRPRKSKHKDTTNCNQVALGHEQSNVLPTKSQRKRIAKHELYSNAEAMNSVMNKAEEIKASLPDDHPSFIKTMLYSHVTIGFWLGFSREFCDDHMPMVDHNVELEDENGVIWTAKYLAGKLGLSGGWRKFSVDHHLVEGDVLVFQLVKPTKFKVHIVRRNSFEELHVALASLNSGAPQPSEDANKKCCEKIEDQDFDLRLVGQESLDEQDDDNNDDNEIKGFGQEKPGSMKLKESASSSTQPYRFEDFKIVTANGSTINSELPEHVGFRYYKLCCSRNSFLHRSILKDLNSKLIAGMITETVSIADSMTSLEVSTVRDEDFATWGSKLKAFEKLGMEVGFLRVRLKELKCIFDKVNKYKKLRGERVVVEEKVGKLEAQIGEAKRELEEVDCEIGKLGFDGNGVEIAFVELATSPW